MDTDISDREMVLNALASKDAFGIIIERYEAQLARYIRRLGARNTDDIADILQETFISVYRNLNDFDVSLKFSSWIYRIAHNETMDWFRRKKVRPEGHLAELGDEVMTILSDEDMRSDEHTTRSFDAQLIERALNELEQKYRDVIILRYFEHKEYDEISDIMRIPMGTVATLLFRAKRTLKEILAHYHMDI